MKKEIIKNGRNWKQLYIDFFFFPPKKREGFCQLLQQMKNKHSEKPEPDMITVFVGTWNMGNAANIAHGWVRLNAWLMMQQRRKYTLLICRKRRTSPQHQLMVSV